VAFIIKSAQTAVSPLARASYDRQVDIYKLAKMGNRDSARLWNDFAAENPATARIIVADVATEAATVAKANKSVDKRLRKAEKLVTKGRVKPARTVAEAAEIEHSLTQRELQKIAARSFMNSANPADREAAKGLL
jgi:hypothetical protein